MYGRQLLLGVAKQFLSERHSARRRSEMAISE